MKSEKNELATLSPQQSNCFTAVPEDFEITRESDEVGHGQMSDALLAQAGKVSHRRPTKTWRPTEASDAGKPHTAGMGE